MRYITKDDFIESYSKLHQRGVSFFLSKFNIKAEERVKSTFNDAAIQASNWWIIPAVKQRWNQLISGDKATIYEDYTVEKYLKGKYGLKMLSLGSGVSSHEINFAKHNCFDEVVCVDISDQLMQKGKETATHLGLKNIKFQVGDVNTMDLSAGYYDVILFHSALHHFKNVDGLLLKVKAALKPDGYLVLNDYVGPDRLQWTNAQLKETNRILKEVIPIDYRKRFKTNKIKTSVSGPGWWRMLISDPSEAVEAERIKPALKREFTTIEETKIGGNLLTLVLKDIAHNFLDEREETQALLQTLFSLEDEFLKQHDSDLIFGVYQKKR